MVLGQLSLASLWVAKSSTSFGWGKGGNVTSAGWQVTLCDPVWHVPSHMQVLVAVWHAANCCIPSTLLFRICPVAGKVTVGLASHWPCVTDFTSYGLTA